MARAELAERTLVVLATVVGLSAPACGDDGDPKMGRARLTETGLYSDASTRALAPGILAFTPAHPLWADGAEKTRYLYVPPGTKIDTQDVDRWTFPVGTKAWKEFRVGGKLIETRFMWKRSAAPGFESWWTAAYVWEDDGRDAVARLEGVPNALGTTHDVPSQEDCKTCHAYVKDAIIGFSAVELSNPSTGALVGLGRQGLFTQTPAADFVVPGEGTVRNALAYLHGNCGFCHNDRLEALIKRSMKLRLLFGDRSAEETGAYTTTFGTKAFHDIGGATELIVPGDPMKSQAYRRMVNPGILRMPPKGTKQVDPVGSELIKTWIEGLPR